MMRNNILIFISLLIGSIVLDQYIKYLFVDGFRGSFECISFVLTYNKGVAFSMLEGLGESLKYIQIVLILGLFVYFYYDREFIRQHFIAMAFILGGGISNVIDRFLHQGVVDFVYWHCWFDFAIFNTADVFINIGAFLILLSFLLNYLKERKIKNG